ncbi:MAG: hypothetical protein A2687_02380 [Candidatus Levybacteria bacterium RIFCSPHIGHO2_01_FULL_38_26]|nr:MAG: hypothetical protein A2687_02380 [Candidatus Levybacteria bacterium RIFCSPHIGHO2_01_FULL_38_26]
MKIDGAGIANTILEELKVKVNNLGNKNIIPHLAVILVGNEPSSVSYVTQKEIRGESIGVKVSVKNISTNIIQTRLLETIDSLNSDRNVHGIIVQRPLPQSIDPNAISLAINPEKDVDGFHPESKFQPPIALAVLNILEKIYDFSSNADEHNFSGWLASKKIAIVGKGETGGKPIADTFGKMDIKPEIVDSKTPNSQNLTTKADIIISAVGKANTIKHDTIKSGAMLISVGLHKGEDGKLHGDYDEEKIKNVASFYTPTPGGVGPVNVAMLLKNLVKAAEISMS